MHENPTTQSLYSPLSNFPKDLTIKDETKKATDAASRKAEREVKLAKDEVVACKAKIDDFEQRLTKVNCLWEEY